MLVRLGRVGQERTYHQTLYSVSALLCSQFAEMKARSRCLRDRIEVHCPAGVCLRFTNQGSLRVDLLQTVRYSDPFCTGSIQRTETQRDRGEGNGQLCLLLSCCQEPGIS